MIPKYALLLVITIILIEIFRIKKKQGATWGEITAVSIEFFRLPYLTLLNLSFFFCLVSIQLTMWFYYITGRYINFYQAIFALWYFTVLAVSIKHYKVETYDKRIFLLFLYALSVPVALANFNIKATMLGIKELMIPFFLYFFLKITLDSLEKLYVFLRVVAYGSAVASVYVIIESINRAAAFWPPMWEVPLQFTQTFRPHLKFYARDLAKLVSVYVRPLGIYLDMHASSFLLMTGFFIVLILGGKLFRSRRTALFLQALLFAGIIFSTIKTYIVMTVGLLFVISLVKRRLKLRNTGVLEHMNRNLNLSYKMLALTLTVFLVFFFAVFQHMILRVVGLGIGQASYIFYIEGFIHLITTRIPQQLLTHPLNFLLGYGYGTPLSLAGEMHYLGRLLALLGWAGFFLYWAVFLRVARECLSAIKKLDRENKDMTLFVFGFIICVAIAGSLIHYSPFNLSGHYIGALVLLIGDQAFKYNRGRTSILFGPDEKNGG